MSKPMTADEALAVMDGMAVEAYRYRLYRETESPEASAADAQARATFAAMVARNAELERQNDEILARNVELDKTMGAMESERDALRAEVEGLRKYAERWRLARMLIPADTIAIEEQVRADENEWLSEQESLSADTAIDRIQNAVARAESGSHE